jgi:hypothetical protein
MVTSEKIINLNANSGYEVVGENNNYQKMPSWVKYPHLYDNLSTLRELGLSVSEIGLLYVSFLAKKKSGEIINKSHASSVKPLKRDIQKKTRDYFSQIKNNLKYDGLKPDEIIPSPDLPSLRKEFEGYGRENETIEAVVNKLLEGESAFKKIGEALIAGAEVYKRKKGSIDSPYIFKLYIEYDGILRALKKEAKAASSKQRI